MNNQFSREIEKKLGIDMRSVSIVADMFRGNNRADEYKVRRAVRHAGRLTGKRFPKHWEQAMVNKIISKRNR